MVPGFEASLIERCRHAPDHRGDVPGGLRSRRSPGQDREVRDRRSSEIKAAAPIVVDDDFAKQLGPEGLDDLRTRSRGGWPTTTGIRPQQGEASCFRPSGRALPVRRAARHGRARVRGHLAPARGRDGADRPDLRGKGQTEEQLRAEYRRIAERRVRLGLILSDIGNRNDIKVEPQELQQAILRRPAGFPARSSRCSSIFRDTPAALEQLRAPIFEDKVVDFILQLAQGHRGPVTPEALMAEPEPRTRPGRRRLARMHPGPTRA